MSFIKGVGDGMTGEERYANDQQRMKEDLENPKPGLKPAGYTCVLQPHPVPLVREGGLFVGLSTEEQFRMLTAQRKCRLVAVGGAAFCDSSERWKMEKQKPQVGDDVIIDQFAGDFFKSDVDGKHYRMVNDDEIIAMVEKE